MSIELYYEKFRQNTIGYYQNFDTPYGTQRMIYADWVASGRLYRPIEQIIAETLGPYIGNTHTETSETGTLMTKAYHHAHNKIKQHTGADRNDVIITAGAGMTTVINKFQRMLGLKICGNLFKGKCIYDRERPVIFITHMEHHSNHTSWYETIGDIVILKPDENLTIDLNHLEYELKKYKNRKVKIGSFTACSNVTGIQTPYHQMAELMHKYGGKCFIDFAASAPYVDINMHPAKQEQKLDAILFSPHKFLGGPGTSGVLIFDSALYNNKSPDQPGGGTIDWTNPWGGYKYIDDIELREDGGTPGFLQAIKAALCIELKEQLDTSKMKIREEELIEIAFKELSNIEGLHILADNVTDRLGIISFYSDCIHYNLIVRLLNDRYGVQVRGGCACAGTYGHFLLNVDYEHSKMITDRINFGDLSLKPGWIRLSLHPIITNDELLYITEAIREITKNHKKWSEDYTYNKNTNEFRHIKESDEKDRRVLEWFRKLYL
ncbi:MAG: aminotransferase class V-fold PLP-dependent enzyme [Ignavibacteria bacterium]|nr:aminotransferase class V-fold PLP-dependent enzyme [Ignavibacteria bacterium]